jgi:hypothetical protein
MNHYIHEQLLATRRQEIQREVEQYRLVACLPSRRGSLLLHAVGMLGSLLVTVGTHLKKAELASESVKAA